MMMMMMMVVVVVVVVVVMMMMTEQNAYNCVCTVSLLEGGKDRSLIWKEKQEIVDHNRKYEVKWKRV